MTTLQDANISTTGYKKKHCWTQIFALLDGIIALQDVNISDTGFKYLHNRTQISSLQDAMTALDNGHLGPQN